MKNYLDCVPCFFKQWIETARMAGAADDQVKRIIDQAGFCLKDLKLNVRQPEIVFMGHEIIKRELDNPDPYKKIKEKLNNWAISLYPSLKKIISKSSDPLLTATKIAIVGNYFDITPQMSPQLLKNIDLVLRGNLKEINQANPGLFQYINFKKKLFDASTIVYLADNAGELVFDRVLIETIKEMDNNKRIILVTREQPILNDCLQDDAVKCGLDSCSEIMSSGCRTPGTIPEFCSPAFLYTFKCADMVISKGQGNYESLVKLEDTRIFHLYNAECDILAYELGAEIGDMILIGNKG